MWGIVWNVTLRRIESWLCMNINVKNAEKFQNYWCFHPMKFLTVKNVDQPSLKRCFRALRFPRVHRLQTHLCRVVHLVDVVMEETADWIKNWICKITNFLHLFHYEWQYEIISVMIFFPSPNLTGEGMKVKNTIKYLSQTLTFECFLIVIS